MRDSFSLQDEKLVVSFRVTGPATEGWAVASSRSAQGIGSGLIGTAIRAIDVTAIAVTTEKDLAVATRALKHPGTGIHRQTRPMRAGF